MQLPAEWRELPLSAVTIPSAGWDPRVSSREMIQYIDVSAVDRDLLTVTSPTQYAPKAAPGRARKLVVEGDIIFATIRPTLRRIAQIPAELDGEVASTAFCVLHPDRAQVDPGYLYFAVQTEELMSRVAALESGASYPAVRDSDVRDQLIWVPQLNEQAEIARVLSAVRGAFLRERESEITSIRLKHAAMQTLFTRGLHGEAQKETDIGMVPERWVIEPLEAHHHVVSGGTPSRSNPLYWRNGTIPWVKTTEVDYCEVRSTEEHITSIGLQESAAKMLAPGTILLAMYGQGITRGKVAILEIEAACNQACAAISPIDEAVETKYLYHQLVLRYDEIRQLAHGGQQQNLNLETVRQLPIAFPNDVAEQRDIVAILDALDRKIDLHRRKRAVLDELFKALLQKLMTGEIRVGDLDLLALDSVPGAAESEAA